MRLRHQALIAAVALACLPGTGCARLLGALVAPQAAAASTASQIADRATAPVRGQTSELAREIDRMLAGEPANRAELARIRDELGRREHQDRTWTGSAQEEARRRAADMRRGAADTRPADRLGLARRPAAAPRGLAASSRVPDGIPAGDPPLGYDSGTLRHLGGVRERVR